jgi:hypothetical protein
MRTSKSEVGTYWARKAKEIAQRNPPPKTTKKKQVAINPLQRDFWKP